MAEVVQIDEARRRARMAGQQAPQVSGDPEQKQRIKLWMAACLILVAIFIDLLQGLLTFVGIGVFLSPIISVATSFLYWIWYKMLGISFVNSPKQLATFATESFLEILPLADVAPVWTIGTIITVIVTRSEDKGGIIGKVASMAENPLKKAA